MPRTTRSTKPQPGGSQTADKAAEAEVEMVTNVNKPVPKANRRQNSTDMMQAMPEKRKKITKGNSSPKGKGRLGKGQHSPYKNSKSNTP